jgi:internalin A
MSKQKKKRTPEEAFAEAEKRIQKALKTGATELDLGGLGLTELPESIGQLSRLQKLFLSNNQLTSLPESIGQLNHLRELELNFIPQLILERSIGKLNELQVLSAVANQLEVFPEWISQLSQLRQIYFQSNNFQSLPNSLGVLKELRILCVWGNKLVALPDSIGSLHKLESIYIEDNQITTLPESLGQLSQLRKLKAENNRLIALPESLRRLSMLEELYLHGNDALGLPPEVLGSSDFDDKSNLTKPADILDYYFRTRGGKRPLNEAKLILVGRGAVGKTSLVNRLVYKKFSKRERKTEGIKITEWPLTLKRKRNVKLNIWDFGGQEIMHATHQFFLSQRSLYLLVLNGREGGEDADAEYWLKLIAAFGGNSPIIIVLNKIKEHPFDLNRRALQEKYPSIKDFVKTDCETGSGIEQLRAIIERETSRLENLRASFPATWFEIKRKLPESKKDFLSYKEFREFCAKHGEKDEKAQDQLAGFLHELGIALNYKDDPRLNDTHVLNPHWVTTGIYKILNSKKLEKQKGEIHSKDISKVLDSKTYPPKMRGFLLDLMKRFELCFTFPESDGRYLIPELLDKQEPKASREFNPTECLNFQYHYPILPEGLLPRFIVRTHVLSENSPRWRTGVILQFEESRALVKADPQEKKVLISVSGKPEGRRRLLAIIRSDFERIHQDIRNLQPLEMVPLPDHPNVVVSHKELMVMAQNGIDTTQKVVGNDVVDLDVSRMLTDVDLEGALKIRQYVEVLKLRDILGTPSIARPVRVFISYSHKDERYREQLEIHLKLLKRNGLIEIWHDRKINPSEEWRDKIDENLERADIILLLISADFIASDYCYDVEMKRALERHDSSDARVIPVIVRKVKWTTSPLGKLQGLPKEGKPVKTWKDRDAAWSNVSEGIEQVVEELRKNRDSSANAKTEILS